MTFVLMGALACRQPLHVSTLQVGRSLNADRTIATHTTRFKPDDTIYASVLTDRTGSSTVLARWSYAGRVVIEMHKDVSYKGPSATEFHSKARRVSPKATTRSISSSTASLSLPGISGLSRERPDTGAGASGKASSTSRFSSTINLGRMTFNRW